MVPVTDLLLEGLVQLRIGEYSAVAKDIAEFKCLHTVDY